MTLLRPLTSAVVLVCVACSGPVRDPAAAEESVQAIFEEYFEASKQLNPVSATFQGDYRYNDRYPNFLGEEHRDRALEMERAYLDRIRAINPATLGSDERLSYEVFRADRELAIQGYRHPAYLAPINQFYNPANQFAQLGSGQGGHPFRNVKDYEDFLSRADGFAVLIDQAIANMREGIEQGVVQPRVLMKKVMPQLAAQVVEDPADSIFYGPIQSMPDAIGSEDRGRLERAYRKKISRVLVPAYARLHDFIRDEYIEAARETAGLGALPGGNAWYRHLVRRYTATELTPDQIHRIGLDEVARIHAEIRGVMSEVEFAGDMAEFFEFTKTDARFIFQSREALLDAYRAMRARVEPNLPRLFSIAPRSDFEIRLVEPFREASASAASYQRGSPDGSRKGIFYVNAYDLSARPTWAVESLYLHEAQPGHHFQLTIQQELDALPSFRRFGGSTAYTEGWGLYSESLGKELGVYSDPYQYFGALSAELWRAIRLVVDTGLHAKGWSREEVLEYMYANAPVAPARAISEAERFMAIPGQALAYKVGQLKLQELRERSERALGNDFDIREFHTQILADGGLPLNVLEDKIERWLDQSK